MKSSKNIYGLNIKLALFYTKHLVCEEGKLNLKLFFRSTCCSTFIVLLLQFIQIKFFSYLIDQSFLQNVKIMYGNVDEGRESGWKRQWKRGNSLTWMSY